MGHHTLITMHIIHTQNTNTHTHTTVVIVTSLEQSLSYSGLEFLF